MTREDMKKRRMTLYRELDRLAGKVYQMVA
jgi:hypothetical protein